MDRLDGVNSGGAGFVDELSGPSRGQNNSVSRGLLRRISGLFGGRSRRIAQAPLGVTTVASNSDQRLASRINAPSVNSVDSDNNYEMPEHIQRTPSPVYEAMHFPNEDGYTYIEATDESDFLKSEERHRQPENVYEIPQRVVQEDVENVYEIPQRIVQEDVENVYEIPQRIAQEDVENVYEMPENVSRSQYSLPSQERVVYLLPPAEVPSPSFYRQLDRVRQIDREDSFAFEESDDSPLYIEQEYDHETGRILQCTHHAHRRVYFEHQPIESSRSSPSDAMFADLPLNAFGPPSREDLSFDKGPILLGQRQPEIEGFRPVSLSDVNRPDSGIGKSPPKSDSD